MDVLLSAVGEPPPLLVWPEHHAAVSLFIMCQTQWRAGAMGLIGLDYGVVFQMMSLYDVEDKATALEDLQIMEARALEVLNKRAEASK